MNLFSIFVFVFGYIVEDYIGYTCAACYIGQINYEGKAMRIDGGQPWGYEQLPDKWLLHPTCIMVRLIHSYPSKDQATRKMENTDLLLYRRESGI